MAGGELRRRVTSDSIADPTYSAQGPQMRSDQPFRKSAARLVAPSRERETVSLYSRSAPFDSAPLRSSAISRKRRLSPSSTASAPVNSCQRTTAVSVYLGSNSISRACRPVFSHPISVEPEPPKVARRVTWRSAGSGESFRVTEAGFDLLFRRS